MYKEQFLRNIDWKIGKAMLNKSICFFLYKMGYLSIYLPCPFWHEVVAPDRILCMSQLELFDF